MNGMAYIMVVFGIVLAKGLGFFRDIIFASTFGATVQTDMYFQLFGLVNLVFTGIGVALSTLVIKQLNKEECNTEQKKKEYVSSFITKTSGVVLIVTALLYLFAKEAAGLLLPGLNPKELLEATNLMYIMLPSFLFTIIAYIISGVLQNNGVFFITSIMSLPFNVVIIASLLFPNVSIFTVGIVTTIGWLLHIIVQLPAFYKKGYKLFNFKRGIKKSTTKNGELLYIFISNMMFQACFMIDKAFVSGHAGAASTINYASNLFITIASVFVVAMSNVVFPSISKNYEEGNIKYVRSLLKYIITIMTAIFTAFILTVCCFGKNIIAILYERGEFTSDLTSQTAMLFAIYTLGALGYLCQDLFNKILYLDSKYSYTVIGTIAVILLKPVLNKILLPFGAWAVAGSTTVLFTLYAVNIAFALIKVTGNYFDKELIRNIIKIFTAGLIAFIVFIMTKEFMPSFFEGKIGFIIPLMLCAVSYIFILWKNQIIKTIISGRKTEGEVL